MAITSINLGYVTGAKLYKNSDSKSTQQQVVAAAATLYELQIDNTANAAQDNYLKLYDSAVAVTVGTTDPEYVFRVRQGVKRSMVFPDGLAFVNGIVEATVTTKGTPGTTNPGSAVAVDLVYA